MIDWENDDVVRVNGTPVNYSVFGFSEAPGLALSKSRALAEVFTERIAPFTGGSVLEIGVAKGGSVALTCGAIRPEKLVAIELEQERVEPLDQFVEENDLTEVVEIHYGVDQGDKARLTSIIESAFPEGIDLVVDDGSHLAGPTARSFECLFPHLVDGGLYSIEDWAWELKTANLLADVLVDSPGGGGLPSPMQSRSGLGRKLMTVMADHLPDDGVSFEDRLASVLRLFESSTADDNYLEGEVSQEMPTARWVDRRPLSDVLHQILLLHGCTDDLIRDLQVDPAFFSIRRGSAPLPKDGVSLEAQLLEPFSDSAGSA